MAGREWKMGPLHAWEPYNQLRAEMELMAHDYKLRFLPSVLEHSKARPSKLCMLGMIPLVYG